MTLTEKIHYLFACQIKGETFSKYLPFLWAKWCVFLDVRTAFIGYMFLRRVLSLRVRSALVPSRLWLYFDTESAQVCDRQLLHGQIL
jgi:hypothetical protein